MAILEKKMRELITKRCGGVEFDAPGGGYSFSDILAEERELSKDNVSGRPDSALLTLSIADPTWKMPEEAMEASMDYYRRYPHSTRYTDNSGVRMKMEGGGLVDTQEALSRIGNLMIPGASWVQYSPGAIKRALAEFIPTLLFDSDTVLIFPTPGYPVIKSEMNRRGAQIVDVPMRFKDGRWSFDFDKMVEKANHALCSKRFLYMSVPNNPTSIAFNKDEWQKVLAWAEENDIYLIVDEAYAMICYRQGAVSVLTVSGWEKRCIVLQSISKGWNATGARIGWIVAHPTLIKGLRKVIDVKDSGGFGPTIAAAIYCLMHPELATETREKYRRLHKVLCDGLNHSGFNTQMPDGGLCQLTPAPKSANGHVFGSAIECAQWFRKELRISLMQYEVNGKGYLRWAVTLQPIPECGLPDEISVIEEVVRRLKSVKFEF